MRQALTLLLKEPNPETSSKKKADDVVENDELPPSTASVDIEETPSPDIDKQLGDSPSLGSKDGISVSMIVVASDQRSSSSFLAHKILGAMPCHLSLNEIFISSQSGDAWKTVGREMHLHPHKSKKDPLQMASFVLEVSRRRCYKLLSEDEELQNECRNHCWVNYKHFPIRGHLPDKSNEGVWDALIDQNEDFQHNPGASFAMAILERDVKDRYRSHWLARKTGDWDINGSQEHKEKLAEIADQVPYNSSDAQGFYDRHKNWFQKVRAYANSTLRTRQIPVINLSYDDTTSRPVNKTQKEMQGILDAAYGAN